MFFNSSRNSTVKKITAHVKKGSLIKKMFPKNIIVKPVVNKKLW